MVESRLRCKRKLTDFPIFGVVKRMKLDVLEDYQWVRLDLRKHTDKKKAKAPEITRGVQAGLSGSWGGGAKPKSRLKT